MKSATLTRHLRSSDASLCMFHTDYIIWEYLFSIWIGSFESTHFTFYRYVFISVRQVYTEFLSFGSSSQRPRQQKARPFCFNFFTKAHCYCEGTQINLESLQFRKMYYSYLCDNKWGSILRVSDLSGASICAAVSTTVQLPRSAQTE